MNTENLDVRYWMAYQSGKELFSVTAHTHTLGSPFPYSTVQCGAVQCSSSPALVGVFACTDALALCPPATEEKQHLSWRRFVYHVGIRPPPPLSPPNIQIYTIDTTVVTVGRAIVFAVELLLKLCFPRQRVEALFFVFVF